MNTSTPYIRGRNDRNGKRRGAILMIFALVAAPLLLMAGLVLDGGMLYFQKRRMQAAADAGAWAGAQEVLRGNDGTVTTGARDDTSLNGFTHDGSDVKVTVNRPPATGPASSNPDAVEVIIEQKAPISLMPIILGSDPIVRARAVAAVEPDLSPVCILALNETATGAITFSGTANLIAPSCAVQANSNGNPAITANGSVNGHHGGVGIRQPRRQLRSKRRQRNAQSRSFACAACSGPVRALHRARPAGAPVATNKKITGGTETLSPGYYKGGLDISGGTVTLTPGTYIVDGLKMTGGSLTCPTCTGNSGVTLFNTGANKNMNFNINGNSYIDLKAPIETLAPTDDQYGCSSMLFWNSKYAALPNGNSTTADGDIRGTADSYFEGNFYFPTVGLLYGGNANVPSTDVYTMIVADTFKIAGNPTLGVNWEATGRPAPVRTVAMVE